MGVCNCSMFCCTLLYVHSSIAIILMGKRELIALLNLSSWCLVMVERLFLAMPRGCLQFVIVVFPDHTHLLLLLEITCRGSYNVNTIKVIYVLNDRVTNNQNLSALCKIGKEIEYFEFYTNMYKLAQKLSKLLFLGSNSLLIFSCLIS